MKLLILAATSLVCACSFLPPTYDNNEYMQFAKLETHSRVLREECAYPELVKERLQLMQWDAELLNSYSFFLPRNSDIFEISKILGDDVHEMKERYEREVPPSTTYCKIKSKAFTAKAREALKSVGNLKQD